MSRFIACISDCAEATLADLCYEFIQRKGELPSDEEIYSLLKQSISLDDAFHQINRLFAVKTKEALLNAFSVKHRSTESKILKAKFQPKDDTPAEDNCTFRYSHYIVDEPDTESLMKFYDYLENLEKQFFLKKIDIQNTLILDVTKQVFEGILYVIDEGVYYPAVDSSCGESETVIIEWAFLCDMAKTSENFREKLDFFYQIVKGLQRDLKTEIHQCKPYFIMLRVDLTQN